MSSIDRNLRFAAFVEKELKAQEKPPVKEWYFSGLFDAVKIKWESFVHNKSIGQAASDLNAKGKITLAALRWFSDDTIKSQAFIPINPDDLKVAIVHARTDHTKAALADIFQRTYPSIAKVTLKNGEKLEAETLLVNLSTLAQNLHNPVLAHDFQSNHSPAMRDYIPQLAQLKNSYVDLVGRVEGGALDKRATVQVHIAATRLSEVSVAEALRITKKALVAAELQLIFNRIAEKYLPDPDFDYYVLQPTNFADIREELERARALLQENPDIQFNNVPVPLFQDGLFGGKKFTLSTLSEAATVYIQDIQQRDTVKPAPDALLPAPDALSIDTIMRPLSEQELENWRT